jgi:hypothetical protein
MTAKCPACNSTPREVWMTYSSFMYCDTCKDDVSKLRPKSIGLKYSSIATDSYISDVANYAVASGASIVYKPAQQQMQSMQKMKPNWVPRVTQVRPIGGNWITFDSFCPCPDPNCQTWYDSDGDMNDGFDGWLSM